jgi:hypothetical protein
MKPLSLISKASIIATFALAGSLIANAQVVLFEENFNSMSNGTLSGQGGWTLGTTNSPSIVTGPGAFSPANTSKVVRNSTSATTGNTWANYALTPSFGANTTGVLSVDLGRGGASANSTITGVSFTNNGSATGVGGVGFGLLSTQLKFLQNGVSTAGNTLMTDISGTSFSASPNIWYRLEANLNFTTNTITSVFVTNLSTSATSQVYFGAGNATMSYSTDEVNWNRVIIRTGLSTETIAYLDNISLTAVPEPSAVVLLCASLGIAACLFKARRRLPQVPGPR